MNNRLLLIAFLAVLLSNRSMFAESLATFQNDLHAIPSQVRVARLESLLADATDSDKRVIELLLTDAKYEYKKRQFAAQMFSLARDRIHALPTDIESAFVREAILFDTLSIIQAIPFGWLSTAEQLQAVELLNMIEGDLSSPQDQGLSPDANISDNSTTVTGPIDEAITIINIALENAMKENLSLIAEAQPNRMLYVCLQECESARELLMHHSPDGIGPTRSRWEAAMMHLSNAVTILKQRQRLKYALWAEGRYRDTNPNNLTDKLGEARAMELYRHLSVVDMSLVAEPSLSREITKRLFELYDNIDSVRAKERVRYNAIISLDQRKTLDDF